MTKIQKIWLNVFIIIIGYVLPIVVLRNINDRDEKVYRNQLVIFLVILVSGIFLTYYNNRNRIKHTELKTWFILIEILGVMGIIFALVPLYFMYAFHNGFNF